MKETSTHIYFWGSYLSNWYNCTLKDETYTYQTSEGYLMAQKAILFNDRDSLAKILRSKDPKEQKLIGRGVKNFDKPIWEEHRLEIMVRGLVLKFGQNEDIKNKLLATGNKILVEGSPYDDIWGVKLRFTDPLILDEANWKGLNLLGIALMQARSILAQQ